MIEKIVVHECSYDENGIHRQDIEIYYSFVGKIFTFLLFFYHTSAKSQGRKQLVAGGGVALIGMILVPQLTRLFG